MKVITYFALFHGAGYKSAPIFFFSYQRNDVENSCHRTDETAKEYLLYSVKAVT
jgi:hypothetical protein